MDTPAEAASFDPDSQSPMMTAAPLPIPLRPITNTETAALANVLLLLPAISTAANFYIDFNQMRRRLAS
jgi:hypothetical protein